MAAIIRSAKSVSDWSANDLRAYNVIVVDEDPATFFGAAQLPPPPVHLAILTNVDYPENGLPDRKDRLFFDFLPMPGNPSSFVADFTTHLLGMLDYDNMNALSAGQYSHPFSPAEAMWTPMRICA
jgi:hypothetical protein